MQFAEDAHGDVKHTVEVHRIPVSDERHRDATTTAAPKATVFSQ